MCYASFLQWKKQYWPQKAAYMSYHPEAVKDSLMNLKKKKESLSLVDTALHQQSPDGMVLTSIYVFCKN